MKAKGDGKAGGGLRARVRAYDEEAKTGYITNGNGILNQKVHRPGSQNPCKGGPGR